MTRRTKQRFDEKWSKDGDCWVWQAGELHRGYGGFYLDGEMIGAHRASIEIHKDGVPEGKYVLHTCDRKMCVNPEHLYVGTQQENIDDALERGQVVTGEDNPSTKLTRKDVQDIRTLYNSSDITQSELGKEYGVDQSTVSKILNGEWWQ